MHEFIGTKMNKDTEKAGLRFDRIEAYQEVTNSPPIDIPQTKIFMMSGKELVVNCSVDDLEEMINNAFGLTFCPGQEGE